ncbi:Na+/H+ antiporter subunit D [Hoeflea prorocentri]|uniref:Na+/H+ antiporter subunit D n=1 Tax=Hoeflea prorocentri TaxID=1922333 RepID=A0A9X3UHP0_9HYPH|nr:Na+/H+ antiporter subunit D [Hoeflea prorocentri]MCY6381527.1 Na+/H+ antiporter subunit D [Hoeflea prorocentri]MDA5399327.1 Na+/H+ antiporter subunit D [Hoeflea prorocentri]
MASSQKTPVDLSAAMILEPPPLADWLVIAPVLLCMGLGALLLMIRKDTRIQPLIAIPSLVALVVINAALLVHVILNGPVTMTMGRWLPPFGISFTVDILGAVLNLTAAIAALAGGIYGAGDVNKSGRRYGFYPFLLLMMAGVSGAFLTGDIFNLYVWFEVLLIASFGLLVLGSDKRQIDGATKYAFLNLVATTLFLIATGYLYGIFGTLNMADIAQKAPQMSDKAPLVTLLSLYLMAFGMKAAAFPAYFWLPASYHTPRVVVSALFAGLLTKVGVYALMRVAFVLFPAERDMLGWVIAVIAAATMIFGAVGALAQTDSRRLLGYLVISGIGIMFAGIALASPGGITGTIFYAVHSMIVMTALYLASGLAARAGGGFSIATSSGIYSSHVFLAAVTLILFFAVSGLPPFSGFWPKVILVKASLDVGAWWLAGAILVSGFLTTIAVGRVWVLAYWRPAVVQRETAPVDLSPMIDYAPVVGLTVLVVLLGIFPQQMLELSQTGSEQMLNPMDYIRSVFPQGAQP